VRWYRGELLPGSYDDWVLAARSELEDRCVELYDRLTVALRQAGDLEAAVAAARDRIRLRPLEEIGYRRLIHLQGDLGDRAGALTTYHHAASIMERELGVEPDPATRRVLDRILARADAKPVPQVTPVPVRTGPASAQLVGRAAELGRLRAAWRAAAQGRPGLVLVTGGAGVGKTRLVTELAATARRAGAVVATTQCFGTAGQLALSPVADWLRTPAMQGAAAQLDPVWRVEVERLVPATGRTRADSGSPAMAEAWQQHRFFEGLARAVAGTGRPTLLVLDNLHWCDQETLRFLAFCLGLLADAPVLVAATARDDDHGAALADWTARMRASGFLTEIAVGPLDAAGTASLAEAIGDGRLSDDDAATLHATTGGFPLYVIEAVRGGSAPAADLPAVLAGRLAQLSAPAREVAGLAAAVGRDFTLDLLSEAGDLDPGTVVSAVDELWRRRIVRETDDGYDFSHDLVRDAAYGQVSRAGRWLRHRRIAQALELLHADDLDTVAVQVGQQYARGGRADRAVDFYRRAAGVASGVFAHGEAIRLYQEALQLVRGLPDGLDRARRELDVLEAMAAPLNARSGYSSPALHETLERSVGLAEMLGRPESVVNGLVGLWTSQFVQGQTAAAHRTAARALALVEPGSPMSGPAHFAFGGSAVSLGRPAEALEHLERAAALGGGHRLSVGTRADVHAMAFAAHAHWLLGHDEQARAAADGAVAVARTTANPFVLVVALAYSGITHQLRADRGSLRQTVDELRSLCARYGFAYYREWAILLDGWLRGGGGGLDRAHRGVTGLTAAGAFARMPYWLSLVADLAAGVDRPDAARAALDAALIGARARDDLWWMPEVLRMRARYDEPAEAVERLQRALGLAREQGSVVLLRRAADDLAVRGVPGAGADPATPVNAAGTPDS